MKTTKLERLHPCREALKWAQEQKNQKQAWNDCERGDWMLWLCGKLSGEPESHKRKKLVLASCECARLALKHVKQGEERPIKTIETAEKWANGKATIEQVRKAAAAAYATAIATAGADAADAAAYAAYTATAGADVAAAYAAYAAAYTAAAAAAAAAYAVYNYANADANADAYAYAAYAATDAADAYAHATYAYATYAGRRKMRLKILKYGIKLLKS